MFPALRMLSNLYGFELNVVQEVEDMISAASMVGCGIGIAIVAESMKNAPIPNVVYRPLINDREIRHSININCYYRKDDRSSLLKAILGIVREYRDGSP